jgi:mRNA-degrading endonuclease RelE of RelBE toxin-antitoxin system
MSFEVKTIPPFEKSLKRLLKKYPSLRQEMLLLIQTLEENAGIGTPIGKNCFKIRMSIQSKGTGKSGGGRVITYVRHSISTVVLLDIYDKGDRNTITDAQLQALLKLVE